MEWAEPSSPAWCWRLVWAVADAAVAAAVLGLGRVAKGTWGSADPDLQGEHGADGTGLCFPAAVGPLHGCSS